MQEFEFKCEECKRPAPYEIDAKGNKKPSIKCDMPNCKGSIKLVND